MKIAVIGAAGKAGSLIAREAMDRGHEVTAIVKPGSESRVPAGCAVLAKSLFDLNAADLKGFAAVVNAFGTPYDQPGKEKEHIDAAKLLIAIGRELPDVRFLTIGGYGSLFTDESKTKRVVDGIPEPYGAVPRAAKEALDLFQASDINWTFFSPAGSFDPDGARSGSYTLGGDVVILNRMGQSYISYADFAVAMVDEIEQAKHVRERVTAVSCDPFFRGAPQYFPVSIYKFSRAGAWMALSIDNVKYGKGKLYLTTSRGNRAHGQSDEGSQLFRIYPTFEGKRVSFATQQIGPAELVLHTRHGDVRFTWARVDRLMAEGDPGMGLEWSRSAAPYEAIRRRKDGAWESIPQHANPLCFKALEGSGFAFGDSWNWYTLNATEIDGFTSPGPDGRFTLAVDEFTYMVKVPEDYGTYAQGKADMTADWEAFLAKYPKLAEPYAAKSEETAYALWTMQVGPSELTPRRMMQMFPGVMGSQWQQVQNGVSLQNCPELSRGLLMAPLERQGADGQLADSYDEAQLETGGIKPPIYGWAIKNILSHRDMAAEWPREELERLYEGAGKWAMWFMDCRDDDNDGLPGFDIGAECGFDEVTAFMEGASMATPDLCAFEVLNFEAQGDLAKLLGKPREEIDGWYKKSRELLDRMLKNMWDGERFVCLKQYTHEHVYSESIVFYIPLILGSRLPADVLDKLCANLLRENRILSPYGIASEDILSDVFEMTGVKMGCGAISPPGQLFILTGLWEGGKKKEAKMIIDRYLGSLMEKGFPHFIDPVNGDGDFMGGSWCRTVFTVLARMVSEG
jgi:putative NADH-flavin reductase